jgi:serine/threonine protein kinase
VDVQVLRHILLRVRALHDAGYVHCNLSPEAFKWYPRENRWMLCEFGHAARAGDPRRAGAGGLSDTKITYAAPEGVAIDDRTESLTLRRDVAAKVPLDVWSFAVVALEVMFGSPLLDATNETEVRSRARCPSCVGRWFLIAFPRSSRLSYMLSEWLHAYARQGATSLVALCCRKHVAQCACSDCEWSV